MLKKARILAKEFFEDEKPGKDDEVSIKTLLIVFVIGLIIIAVLFAVSTYTRSKQNYEEEEKYKYIVNNINTDINPEKTVSIGIANVTSECYIYNFSQSGRIDNYIILIGGTNHTKEGFDGAFISGFTEIKLVYPKKNTSFLIIGFLDDINSRQEIHEVPINIGDGDNMTRVERIFIEKTEKEKEQVFELDNTNISYKADSVHINFGNIEDKFLGLKFIIMCP